MPMIYLRSEFDLCTGCGICLLVCSKRAFGGYNPRLALLRILSEDENLVNRPLVCTQCENPFCLQVCPVHAISKDPETGVVLIDKETCTGCGDCVSACPDHMIRLDNDRKADKCDLCGGDPLCVKYCPSGALKLVELVSKQEVTSK